MYEFRILSTPFLQMKMPMLERVLIGVTVLLMVTPVLMLLLRIPMTKELLSVTPREKFFLID